MLIWSKGIVYGIARPALDVTCIIRTLTGKAVLITERHMLLTTSCCPQSNSVSRVIGAYNESIGSTRGISCNRLSLRIRFEALVFRAEGTCSLKFIAIFLYYFNVDS